MALLGISSIVSLKKFAAVINDPLEEVRKRILQEGNKGEKREIEERERNRGEEKRGIYLLKSVSAAFTLLETLKISSSFAHISFS